MFQTLKSFNTFKLFNEPVLLAQLERFERLELLEPAARRILCALCGQISSSFGSGYAVSGVLRGPMTPASIPPYWTKVQYTAFELFDRKT